MVYLDNFVGLVEGYIDDDGVYGIVCRWKCWVIFLYQKSWKGFTMLDKEVF